jgi:MFS family permease
MKKEGLDRNIKSMGVASFFNDMSSEMILSILPLFLTTTLGAGTAIVGLIEGIAESSSSILKLLSGWISDRFNSRKPLIAAGYAVSNLSKPLLTLATSWPMVLGVKFADRVGKGLRTAPRDALIAASSRKEHQGKSFGFHRMMDTAGAVVGVAITFVLLYFLSMSFEMIFLLTIIPGTLAVLTILLFVKEKRLKGSGNTEIKFTLRGFSPGFRRFIIVSTLFTLGNFSYAFFLIRAHDVGIALALVPLLYLFYNILYTIVAMPVGSLSDKVGKKKILALGFLSFSLVSLGFGFTSSVVLIGILFAGYAVFQAIYEVSSRAMIPDLVEPSRRGTAYGVYHTSVGLAAFPASFVMGSLWQFISVEVAFGFSAVLALVAAALLMVWVKD